MINPLRGLLVVSRRCPEDARHERLRIAIVQREPARLHLDHDPVSREKHVVRGRQREAVQQRPVGRDRSGRLEAFPISTAEDVGRDHQLITAECRLSGHLVGVHVDHLHHPVRVGPLVDAMRFATGCPLIFARRSTPLRRRRRRRVGRTLRVDRPPATAATSAHGRTRLVESAAHGRDGLGGIDTYSSNAASPAAGATKPAFEPAPRYSGVGRTVQPPRAAGGPGRQAPPGVRAGFERDDRRQVSFRRVVLQILIQKRTQDLPREIERRIAVELQRAERAAVLDLLP